MSGDERFGELRSDMHSRHGEDRWLAVCALLQDWPDQEQLREVVIPYLRELFARDEDTVRLAPQGWWWWRGDQLISKHPALSLATGIACDIDDNPTELMIAKQRLAGMRAAGLTCHSLEWHGRGECCAQFLDEANFSPLIALSFSGYPRYFFERDAEALARSPHSGTSRCLSFMTSSLQMKSSRRC